MMYLIRVRDTDSFNKFWNLLSSFGSISLEETIWTLITPMK